MTHDQQARHRFFEAFLAGKYDLCVELSRALEAGGVTLQTLQLLLISLQRLKREAEVAILGPHS